MYVLLMDVKHPWNAGTTQVYIKQANLSTEKKSIIHVKLNFFGKLHKHFSVHEFKKTKVLTVPRKAVKFNINLYNSHFKSVYVNFLIKQVQKLERQRYFLKIKNIRFAFRYKKELLVCNHPLNILVCIYPCTM